MATVRKSKKRFIVPICIVLVLAIAGGAIFGITQGKKGVEVSLTTIGTDDIYETVSLTGDVTSGAAKEYKVGTVATVKDVYVSVGDHVKEGDLLASFDATSVDGQVASLQADYNSASKSYDEAVKEQKDAKSAVKALGSQISSLEKKVNKLKSKKPTATTKKATTKKTSTTATTKKTTSTTNSQLGSVISSALATTTTTTAPSTEASTEPTTLPADRFSVNVSAYPSTLYGTVSGGGVYAKSQAAEIKATPNKGYAFFGWYTSNAAIIAGENPVSTNEKLTVNYTDRAIVYYYAVFVEAQDPNTTSTSQATVNDLVTALAQISSDISSITNDVKTMSTVTQIVATTISNAIASGQIDSETISKLVGDAISQAIKDGIIDSAKLTVESGVAQDTIERAVKAIDFEAISKAVVDSDNATLTAAEIQLATLKAEQEIYKVKASGTSVEAQKTAKDATKKALDAMKAQQTELKNGWKAAFDGVITAVDIYPDSQTTVISSGITLENMDTLVATVSLGEYDVHKVKVGMPATVTTAYGKYEGEVATIAPTATGGGGSSILDNVGSMAGISGLSSLTDSGAGVLCTVTIKDPDENIIVGFDADVEIETGEYLGVPVVPIESIVLEKTGSYVYLYNEEDNTVTKTKIETGAISDSAYEIKSGISVGDMIVSTPASDYKQETFEVKVVDKTTK